MSIDVRNLNQFDLAKYNQLLAELKKEQNKRNEKNEKNTTETKNPFGTMKFISLNNKELNKANLQEYAALISQAKASKNTKSIKDSNKTDKTNKKNDNKIDAKEKSTIKTGAGIIAKEALYRLTTKELFKANPEAIIASLLGVDPEEDGDAFKKGAVTGKGGDFSGDYKKFFNGLKERANKSFGNAFLEGLNLIPNVVSIGLTNCLKYAGNACSKVLGKDLTALVGSGISAVGKGINAVGDTIGSYVKGVCGFYKNLFTGNIKGVKDAICNTGKEIKNIAVSVKDKVVEVAKDVGNFVSNTAKKIGKGIKNFFKKLF